MRYIFPTESDDEGDEAAESTKQRGKRPLLPQRKISEKLTPEKVLEIGNSWYGEAKRVDTVQSPSNTSKNQRETTPKRASIDGPLPLLWQLPEGYIPRYSESSWGEGREYLPFLPTRVQQSPKKRGRLPRFLSRGLKHARSMPIMVEEFYPHQWATQEERELARAAPKHTGSPEKIQRVLGGEVMGPGGKLKTASKTPERMQYELDSMLSARGQKSWSWRRKPKLYADEDRRGFRSLFRREHRSSSNESF